MTASGPLPAIRSAISRRLGQRLAVGHDVVDEADLVGASGGDVVAAEQHLGGDRVADLAAQAHGRTRHGEQAPLHLGHAEHGALARDADVGALEDLGAAGAGEALGREDDRLGRAVGLEPARAR